MTFPARHDFNCYINISGNIPQKVPNDSFISVVREPSLKVYSLGFQPAKSIPEIPRWFLQTYAEKNWTILEPFAGSGTTIIEGIKYGCSVHWLDYHPLSRLICRSKTTEFSTAEVQAEVPKIIQRANQQKYAPTTVRFNNLDFWFQKPVQEALEILKEQITKSHPNNQALLWLAFASTVRKTSNMNDGMLLAARRSHVEKIPLLDRQDVYRYFQMYAHKSIQAIEEWNSILRNYRHQIIDLDCADARQICGNSVYDAIVTSPPYINAIDYVWAAKFELHWLGMVKNDSDRLNLYSREIGTERIPKNECQELGITGNNQIDLLIKDIYTGKKYQATKGQNQMRARVVYQYFMDMKNHFIKSYSALRQGGYYCFSVGDLSRICGVEIPVASLLAEIAEEIGLREQHKFHVFLKNRKLNVPRNVDFAGSIKHDTVIVMKKLDE